MSVDQFSAGNSAGQPKLKRQTLTQAVEARLRDEIIQGLHEPGTMLSEPVLSSALGVSRSPVREALLILERDGIVEFDERGRTRVATMTAADFEDLYLLRLAVEPMVAVHTAAEATAADYAALEANIATMQTSTSVAEISQLDIEFHGLLVAASRRPRLIATWRSLRPSLELWLAALHRQHEKITGRVKEITIESHRELIEILRKGDGVSIEKLMRGHIEGWYQWLPEMHELS
ncbi:GntR family transcriptional regulator [Gimesia panareensis]|uniref:Putative HTH-type transcriptional regulator YdfH n=1 Tax=Gimesia panareensis TaxID=2527978 RepID=A0A518A7R5_9PLAN|nr:GntR family transcriptional regulator [Gimesia panareensis]QDU50745.1 putative HTH-type transcriptional regulator YdfH [Gimesia panareensis]QDV18594.1 putative HTH-type transcriptional regulator YdfH [Gimesia panareensis]